MWLMLYWILMNHNVEIDVFPLRTLVWTGVLLIIDYSLRWVSWKGRSFDLSQIENAKKGYEKMYLSGVDVEGVKCLDIVVLNNVNGMFYGLARGMNDFVVVDS